MNNVSVLACHRQLNIIQHCVKSVSTRSFSGPYFPPFGLNTDQKNSEYGLFPRSATSSRIFFCPSKDACIHYYVIIIIIIMSFIEISLNFSEIIIIIINYSLREKFVFGVFLVRIFLHSD